MNPMKHIFKSDKKHISGEVFGAEYECENIPRITLEPSARGSSSPAPDRPLARFISPPKGVPAPAPDEGRLRYVGKAVASIVTTTYPRGKLGVRFGDPNCDCVGVALFPTRSLCSIADGCGWGQASRDAANVAVEAFLDHAQKAVQGRGEADHTRELARSLIDALAFAHTSILGDEKDVWSRGTTTLLGAAVVPAGKAQKRRWQVVCASVGDCRSFILRASISGAVLFVDEVTRRVRIESKDARDSGGRIGPSETDGSPDLRNMAAAIADADPGDLLLLVTDGVHDNLDPQHLGLSPAKAAELSMYGGKILTEATWESMGETKERDDLKRVYSCWRLAGVLGNTPAEPRAVCDAVIAYCEETVAPTRAKMEKDDDPRQPRDRSKFPGKMDHTSVICVHIGPNDQDQDLHHSGIVERPSAAITDALKAAAPPTDAPEEPTSVITKRPVAAAAAVVTASSGNVVMTPPQTQPQTVSDDDYSSDEEEDTEPTAGSEAEASSTLWVVVAVCAILLLFYLSL